MNRSIELLQGCGDTGLGSGEFSSGREGGEDEEGEPGDGGGGGGGSGLACAPSERRDADVAADPESAAGPRQQPQ